jgi:hypothetical protein
MSRTLTRPCLDCGQAVRGKTRCRRCTAKRDQVQAAKRPARKSYSETERRRRAVADHLVEVAAGGLESGRCARALPLREQPTLRES